MDRDNWRNVFVAIISGLVLSGALVAAATISSKAYILIVAAAVFRFLLVPSRESAYWCLFAFWMAVPLPMHAFLVRLDPLHGGGALGIYLVAADAPLLLLFVFWLLRRPRTLIGPVPHKKFLIALL